MALLLEPSHALDPGDSLWILPMLPESTWYQRLNWLTHFSLTTNELHSRPKMHPWLLKILETCEIEPPQIPVSEPLLVPASQWLPTDWLVTVPYEKDKEELFISTLEKIKAQLKVSNLRLFLPPQSDFSHWNHLCEQHASLTEGLSVVDE